MTGIIITAILIPVSLLALFAIQGVGHGQELAEALFIAWAIVNFITIPFVLLGFIIKYNIKVVTYFAIAHFILSIANMILLLSDTAPGSAGLLAIVSLPSLLYIVGIIAHMQTKKTQSIAP